MGWNGGLWQSGEWWIGGGGKVIVGGRQQSGGRWQWRSARRVADGGEEVAEPLKTEQVEFLTV